MPQVITFLTYGYQQTSNPTVQTLEHEVGNDIADKDMSLSYPFFRIIIIT